MTRRRLLATVSALLAFACATGPAEPVEIVLNEQSCSSCHMAISQREFAAEVVDPAGAVDAFDDIGCLRDWLRQHRPGERVGIFVVDYPTGAWIDAREATFVASKKLPTPMGSGLVAFQEESTALEEAERLEGRLMRWQEVVSGSGS